MNHENYFLGEENHRNIYDYYELTKNELGKGSYGRVQLGKLKGTNLKRAIKIIEKAKVSNVERFKLEVEIMMKLDHPNILRLIDYFEDKKYVYLVLELCTGGELFDRIIANKYYNEEDARIIFKQIIKALHYCHINGVCHRDLKPENFIMISKNDPFTLKIIDFGLSRTFQQNGTVLQETNDDQNNGKRRKTRAVLKTKAGTPFYIAPEVLTGNYNEKCDVWSAGVILYILFCGYPPFYGESNRQILESVKKGKLDFSSVEWQDKSKSAIELVKKMITHHEKRPFADEVLKHEWMFMSKIKQTYKEKVKVLYHNMKKYAKLDKFRQLILYYLVRNLSEEDISHYHNYFDLFDKNNQGSIQKESFIEVLSENLGVDKSQTEEIFNSMDLFDNDRISYSQFISAVIPYTKFFNQKRLIIFFHLGDIDRNQKLSADDLSKFLTIQFKHWQKDMGEFQGKIVKKFDSLFPEEVDFDQFLKVVSEV